VSEPLPTPDDGDDFDDYDEREIGCVDCDSGWRHGCCDDLCYGSVEPQDCDMARACPHCNPRGEYLW
jgi:hypothetical protein